MHQLIPLFAGLLSFLLFFVDHWGLDLVRAGAAIVRMGLVVVLLAAGVSLMATDLVASAGTLSGEHSLVRWVVLALLIGISMGLCSPLLAAAAVHGLPPTDLTAASALNQSARQLGAATAVGVLGSAMLPSPGRYHAVRLLAAGFCALAAAVAVPLQRGPSDPASDPLPNPTPHQRTEEMTA